MILLILIRLGDVWFGSLASKMNSNNLKFEMGKAQKLDFVLKKLQNFTKFDKLHQSCSVKILGNLTWASIICITVKSQFDLY
jgi:hypothetical protein